MGLPASDQTKGSSGLGEVTPHSRPQTWRLSQGVTEFP